MRGPIDYFVIGFEGPKMDGSIMKELEQALQDGVIALVALAVVYKDDNGDVMAIDASESPDGRLTHIAERYNQDSHLLDDDDLAEVGELLPANTAAAVLVIEHLWAKPLKQAILESGGQLVAEGRIHPEAERELSELEV
jgi:hypothetical protein